MQNESQLSKEILDCFVVVNTDQMGNARYDVDFNKLSKEFATARAEGAQEERKLIVNALINEPVRNAKAFGTYEEGWDGGFDDAIRVIEALTTKEHHAE